MINLEGHCVQNRWPKMTITVDGNIAHDGDVQGQLQVNYTAKAQTNQKKCCIDLQYRDKTDADTLVTTQGEIVENQSVNLLALWINGVDIVKTQAIHQGIGQFTMCLPEHKKLYFQQHGISTQPNTHTHMYENGIWHIELALPLLSTLTGLQNQVEPWEQVDVKSLVSLLAEKLDCCYRLQNNV